MKAFIVYCHPSEDSFTSHVRDSFIKGIVDSGNEYVLSDLYRMNFQTDMTEKEYLRDSNYRNTDDLAQDVLAEQGKINSSDAIVFIYPIFWTEAPAKLVGWFDRVWSYGFAYGEKRMKLLDKALILCTAGNTKEKLLKYDLIYSMKKVMFGDRMFNRAKEMEFFVFDGMTKALKSREENWDKNLNTAYEKGKSLFQKSLIKKTDNTTPTRKKTIILVQHTQSVHHTNGHAGAWGDWDLTELGHKQAATIGQYLKNEGIDQSFVLYASDLKRAAQTAEEICRLTDLNPIFREDIREVNAGAGNGKPWDWFNANKIPSSDEYDADYRPFPDAESDRDLWNRLHPFYREILANEDEKILVVSHGTALSFLQSMLMGQTLEDRAVSRFNGASGSVSRFEIDTDGRVTAKYINRQVQVAK